jgi:oligopeptide/dipeptide ABC transporter ATP-binding protein
MNALNPVMRIRDQITEAIRAHSDMTGEAANQRAAEVLDQVGLGRSVEQLYPHELSGGMNQRAVIACAIALKPRLVMADEPTTALDVNVQRAILQLLGDLRDQQGITVVIVSHEMGVHAELVDRIGIVYAGQVVEIASVYRIFGAPQHPYTQGLVAAIPRVGGDRRRLSGIPGIAPSALVWPSGCRFHPRCPRRLDICASVAPVTVEVSPGHRVSCHLYGASAHVNTASA